MSTLFLSPHNDDETLFGAFTLLRHRPHVVIALRSRAQEGRGYVTAEAREAETDAAMEVLGCEWEQWGYADDAFPATPVAEELRRYDAANSPDRVYAPAIEPWSGNPAHDALGRLADEVFYGRVTHYMTYHDHRVKSEGSVRVPYDPEWVLLKLKALACYESQVVYQATCHHFLCDMNEWYG